MARRLNEEKGEQRPNPSGPPSTPCSPIIRFPTMPSTSALSAWKRAWPMTTPRISRRRSALSRPLPIGVTQIESFAACPFQHFVRFGLRLQPRLDRQVGGRELSNAYHDLLGRLIGLAIDKAGAEGAGGVRSITPETVRIESERLRAGWRTSCSPAMAEMLICFAPSSGRCSGSRIAAGGTRPKWEMSSHPNERHLRLWRPAPGGRHRYAARGAGSAARADRSHR